MQTKFQKMQISKGHLLTVKGDVQMIKDAFFKGKLISEICKNFHKTDAFHMNFAIDLAHRKVSVAQG